ncbi:MFS-type transporter cnsO [Physcia stellaris]|nr:MFS-type transporter cnsO [Physcia stellaris]
MALRQDPEKLDFVGEHNTRASSDYDKSYPEHQDIIGLGSYDPIIDQYTAEEVNKVVRRVDLRLVPLCGLMYCVSLLDRTNLSNAAIAGMTKELNLRTKNPDRYSVITLVFFITYVLAQPPTTILTRFFGPRVWLASITLCWGVTMIGFGFVKDWKALMGLRLILGILESGFFPGVVYLLSTWYKRYEVGKRYSIFYLIGSLASAFGGVLAFGLMQMEGVQGYGGWRWIFIIEGCLTCFVALLGYIFLVSFPDKQESLTIRFLSAEERQLIVARVNQDRGDADLENFTFKKWLGGASDWKIWAYGLSFGCATTVTYALAYFLPIILNQELKFDTGTAQCLIAPPYVFAGIVMITTGWFGDKYHQRGICVAFNAMLCIIGLAVMGWAYGDTRARYFGVFLATAGSNANVPSVLTYQANNIRGQWKRAFCSATLVGMGALGGIVGSTVFRSEDSPTYVPGLSVAMGSQVVILLTVGALTVAFRLSNKKADRGEKVLEGSPSFRYTA